jgi:phenylacetate-CoA ligase
MCEYEEGLVAAFKSGTYHTYGKSDLVELPIDTSDRLKPAAIFRTSGTTTPLLVPMTHPELEMITNIGADCFKRSGMNVFVHEIVINCLNLSMWAGGTLDSMSIGKTGATVINFGTGNTSELIKLIDSLTLSHNNVTIHCTPSYLPVIRKKLELEDRIPKSLKLRQIYCGAEGGLDDDTFRSLGVHLPFLKQLSL